MDMMQELGLKATVKSDDDVAEGYLLRSLDRWGDRLVPHYGHMMHEPCETETVEVYIVEPKFRRRLRYQAAILRG
jgi:hypothetical protein